MLTVACVLKSGGIYDATWVARLKSGVAKHLPVAHRFVCLSDVDVPCERIPLENGWAGWWAKIELFKLRGPVLFFDLDTLIVGDLTNIAAAARAHELVMLRDFYRQRGLGSGVMAWKGSVQKFHDAFDPDHHMREFLGDQQFIESVSVNVTRWQDIVGDEIVSYKVHCRNGIPPNARVVCLHGRPKFADMPANDAVRMVWENAA